MGDKPCTLPLRSLNHISRVCRDVHKSLEFYRDVLGFVEIKRPASLEFEGAWLFNYNLGIHLIGGRPERRSCEINPKSDHLSFQSDSLAEVKARLAAAGIACVESSVCEGGVKVSQIFFHDPDENTIEICNCDCLPIVPLAEASLQANLLAPAGGACGLRGAAVSSPRPSACGSAASLSRSQSTSRLMAHDGLCEAPAALPQGAA